MAIKSFYGFKKNGDTYKARDDRVENTLGTSAYKNSTSAVTDSTDLVESGAVLDTLRDVEVIEGKNLLDIKNAPISPSGLTITTNNDNSLTLNGTTTSELNLPSNNGHNTDYNHVKANTTYTFSIGNSRSDVTLQVYYKATGSDSWHLLIGEDGVSSITFTTPSTIYDVWVRIKVVSGKTFSNFTIYPQIEVGSQATAFVPYLLPLKDVVPNKADNSVIAPVENGSTASQAYAVNDVFIRNGALCKVTSAISQGDTLSNQFTVTNVGAILTALLNA